MIFMQIIFEFIFYLNYLNMIINGTMYNFHHIGIIFYYTYNVILDKV